MKRTVAYQAKDGSIHPSAEECRAKDFIVDIRGILQSKKSPHQNLGDTTAIAQIFEANVEELAELALAYRRTKRAKK